MPLEQPIQSIVVSISYGLFFSLLFNLSYAKICKLSKVLKFIISILFLLINTTIYFYFLYQQFYQQTKKKRNRYLQYFRYGKTAYWQGACDRDAEYFGFGNWWRNYWRNYFLKTDADVFISDSGYYNKCKFWNFLAGNRVHDCTFWNSVFSYISL